MRYIAIQSVLLFALLTLALSLSFSKKFDEYVFFRFRLYSLFKDLFAPALRGGSSILTLYFPFVNTFFNFFSPFSSLFSDFLSFFIFTGKKKTIPRLGNRFLYSYFL